jgi:hypothetical protein
MRTVSGQSGRANQEGSVESNTRGTQGSHLPSLTNQWRHLRPTVINQAIALALDELAPAGADRARRTLEGRTDEGLPEAVGRGGLYVLVGSAVA